MDQADRSRTQQLLLTAIERARSLLETVTASAGRLAAIAAALAVADAALFVAPRADDSDFVAGAVVLLAVLLVPAICLVVLLRRFRAFRTALATFVERLPSLATIPGELHGELAAASQEGKAGLLGRMRQLIALRRVLTGVWQRHGEGLDAATTVAGYGPRDLLYAVAGVTGTAVLAVLLPAFALWAALA